MNVIWTNHALQRIKDRKIPQNWVLLSISAFDKEVLNSDGTIEYQKKFEDKTVAAIVKVNERGEGIVVSAWMNPPAIGTKDYKRKQRYYQMQKASPIKKLWLAFLDQMGL